MLVTNHVLAGGVLGLVAPSPGVAACAGLVSHFALDVVPHFGIEDAPVTLIAMPDGLVGLATIAVIVARTPGHRRGRVVAGIVGSCVPDLNKPARRFFGGSPFPRRFDRFHAGIQSESPQRFPVEAAAATALTVSLAMLLRRARAGS